VQISALIGNGTQAPWLLVLVAPGTTGIESSDDGSPAGLVACPANHGVRGDAFINVSGKSVRIFGPRSLIKVVTPPGSYQGKPRYDGTPAGG
jgi:hypothetical protein